MRCMGAERSLSQCLAPPVELSRNCSRLLSVSCRQRCLHLFGQVERGVVTSPGYPQFLLPNLQCSYFFQTRPERLLMLQFLELNIEQIPTADRARDAPDENGTHFKYAKMRINSA